MKLKKHIILVCLAATSLTAKAQDKLDTIKVWNLATYSQTTLSNLTADTQNWTMNSKGGRYQNVKATDGSLLKANGTVIAETDGIYFGSGIAAGNLLLCYNRGSANGVQNQSKSATTLKGLKSGEILHISLRSSSSSANGISAVTNLDGEVGTDTYVGPNFKTYSFTVKEDGDVTFTNTTGIIINEICILKKRELQQVATPSITIQSSVSGNLEGVITCTTEGAKIVYSLVDHGEVWDYARTYTEPFRLTHSVRLRAAATKDGMNASEVAEKKVDIPLTLPYAGKPYILYPEPLSRGTIATKTNSGYLVNWRLLATDPASVAFNVFRNGVKLNSVPITTKTNFLDETLKPSDTSTPSYTVETIVDGNITETCTAKMLTGGYLDIPLDRPANGTTESGEYMYVPGDCMVADLDGDHEYEVVMKWDPCNTNWNPSSMSAVNDVAGTAGQKDNSLSGYTGPVIIDAYKINNSQTPDRLWRIDLGRNIRAGAHYTQLMVYDLDGDGKAEVACKTAPGTIDGQGKNVLMEGDDATADYRGSNSSKTGIIISGPEYLTVFDGETGAERATCAYNPPRNINSAWGDSYGNRSERYLACVAYLGPRPDGSDGLPSLVMCRGYYTQAFLWAVDFDGKEFSTRWLHSSMKAGYGAYGEGAHGLSVADVDGDGRDEIIYGSCAIDDDGELLYRTGLGHGDALHVGDLNPDRDGLEVMMVHEETSAEYGIEMHDALSGKHLTGVFAGSDVGRGMCADVDPTSRGCEYWGYGNDVCDCNGTVISTKKPTVNFRTYWDGDLQEELTERGAITKWTSRTSSASTLVNMISTYKAGADLIKYTPLLQADIFGDWREEQIYYDAETFSHLWIFSTPYESQYRVPCLMHDHQYRMATVWQTSAYNQPPHLSYYLPDYVQNITAIREIKAASDTSADDTLYDLTGRSVSSPSHGIYITRNRKIIKK